MERIAAASLPVILSLLAGCASETMVSAAKAPEEPQAQICSREAPTGSMLVVTRCRTARQVAEDQQGVNQMSDAIRARSPAAGGRPSP